MVLDKYGWYLFYNAQTAEKERAAALKALKRGRQELSGIPIILKRNLPTGGKGGIAPGQAVRCVALLCTGRRACGDVFFFALCGGWACLARVYFVGACTFKDAFCAVECS